MMRLLVVQVLEDALAERAPHVALLYGALAAALCPFAADMTMAASARGAASVGLFLLWLAASAVAVWQGVRAVGGDLASGRAALVLAGPVSPERWVLGRLVGVAVLMAGLVAAMGGLWVGLATLMSVPLTSALPILLVLVWAESCVVAALGALLSVLVRPGMAATGTVGLWVAGHLAHEYTAVTAELGLPVAASVLFALIPDLDLLSLEAEVLHDTAVPLTRTLLALAYAGCWTAALAALTATAVWRRDLL